jgi:hypothetical protein
MKIKTNLRSGDGRTFAGAQLIKNPFVGQNGGQ